MQTNYNRWELLKDALQHEDLTMENLCDQLATDAITLHDDLQNSTETIKKVAGALGIPEAYFWGGLIYQDGKLVPTDGNV